MGQIEYGLHNYTFADQYYSSALVSSPDDPYIKMHLELLKPYVRPSLRSSLGIAQERENDLTTKIRTIEMDYLSSSFIFTYPIKEYLIPYCGFGFFIEKQKNLITKSNNYNVDSYVASLGFESYFKKFWSAKLELNSKYSTNVKTNILPFHKKLVIEPFILFKFTQKNNFGVGNAFADSIIGRNFFQNISYLVRRYQLSALYEYRFLPPDCAIGGQGLVAEYNGRKNNSKRAYGLWMRLGHEIFTGHIIGRYQYDYKEFDKPLPDYSSYKNEQDHLIKISYIKEWKINNAFEISYNHLWRKDNQLTNEAEAILLNPTAPGIINKHHLQANYGEAYLKLSLTSRINLELYGKIYKNTDKYASWQIRAALQGFF